MGHAHNPPTAQASGIREFVISVASIYATFLMFGYFQEKLGSARYGPEQEKFHGVMSLVFLQCLSSAVSASLAVWRSKKPKDSTPWMYYIPVACSYVGAMVCTNFSIQYVSYPTMTLAKSCKPIPVLLVGLLLGKKTTWSRIWCVILISAGVSLFGFDMVSHSKNSTTTEMGLVFLCISLSLDGLTGPLQDLITEKYRPTSDQLMAKINFFATIGLGAIITATGELKELIRMSWEYPEFMMGVMLFGIAGAVGQFAVYYCLVHFGSLICTLITTTRKFFSIVISILVFGHHLSGVQWFSMIIVFLGLGLDSVISNPRFLHYWIQVLSSSKSKDL